MCDFGPRPFLESFDLGLDVRSVLFVLPTSSIQGALRLGDRSLPSLSFLLLGGLFRAFGAPGLRHALLCATYSRSPTLSTFPLLPLMAFRTTDTVFGHPNAANIWNGRLAPKPAVPDRLISRAYCLFAALSLDDPRTLVFGDLA